MILCFMISSDNYYDNEMRNVNSMGIAMANKFFRNILWFEGVALTIILSVSCVPKIDSNETYIEKTPTESPKNSSQKLSNKLYNELTKRNISSRKTIGTFRNLTCEYFDESKCENIDKEKCHKNVTCQNENEFCFTSWKFLSTNEPNAVTQNSIAFDTLASTQSVKVKTMGCMEIWQAHECQKNCVHAKKGIPKHGHLYCCCNGKIF